MTEKLFMISLLWRIYIWKKILLFLNSLTPKLKTGSWNCHLKGFPHGHLNSTVLLEVTMKESWMGFGLSKSKSSCRLYWVKYYCFWTSEIECHWRRERLQLFYCLNLSMTSSTANNTWLVWNYSFSYVWFKIDKVL